MEIRGGVPEAATAAGLAGETLQMSLKERLRAKRPKGTGSFDSGMKALGGGCYWRGFSWEFTGCWHFRPRLYLDFIGRGEDGARKRAAPAENRALPSTALERPRKGSATLERLCLGDRARPRPPELGPASRTWARPQSSAPPHPGLGPSSRARPRPGVRPRPRRPRAGREEAERWGPAPGSHYPAAGRRCSELSPGDLGPQGGERGAPGGAGSRQLGAGCQTGRGVAPGAAVRDRRRGRRWPHVGRYRRPGLDWVGAPGSGLSAPRLSSDKTPPGSLGHGSPEAGTG